MSDVPKLDAVGAQVPDGVAAGSCWGKDRASSWGGASVHDEGPSSKEEESEGVLVSCCAGAAARGAFVGNRAVVESLAGGLVRLTVTRRM